MYLPFLCVLEVEVVVVLGLLIRYLVSLIIETVRQEKFCMFAKNSFPLTVSRKKNINMIYMLYH